MRGDLGNGLGERRRRLHGLLLWAAVPALGLLCAAAAQAAPRTIAEYGSGAGEVRLPVSVAVDNNAASPNYRDLYVADANNFRIDKFDSEGNFLLAWGWGVADGKSQELQVCGPASGREVPRCFAAAQEGSNLASGPGAVAPEAVAVEQSSGDVYVADRLNRRVTKFGPDGEFLYMVGKNVNKTKERDICTAADRKEEDECGAGEGGAVAGSEFASPRSLAVDPAGHLWVGDADRLVELNAEGGFASEIELPGVGPIRSLALDSEGDFYLNSGSPPVVRKLEAGTGNELCVLDEGGEPRAVAVDAEDDVYLGDVTDPYRFKAYDGETCEQVSQFGAGQVIGAPGDFNLGGNAITLDEDAGALYAASSRSSEDKSAVQRFELPGPGPLIEAQRAEGLEPTAAALAATLNPEGHETTYLFEWGTSEGYGHSTPTGALAGEGFDSEEVERAELAGLVPSTTYHFRLVATDHGDPRCAGEECTVYGEDTAFATRPAVAIEAQWVSEVAARDATLEASLDPLGAQGATWWVEYGRGASFDRETAHESLAGPEAVSVPLTGLEPATPYSYRFVAEGEQGASTYTVKGEPRSLTTQPADLGFSLPDGRAWEMVSPPDKHGALIAPPNQGNGSQVQAAASGGALAYLATGSTEADPEGSRAFEVSSILARRGAGGAWGSRDITPPHTEVTPYRPGQGGEYKLFGAELGLGALEPRDCTPLSPRASERTPYLRHNTEPPSYTPLLTAAEVPAGTEFGGDCGANSFAPVHVQGATADLSHVVLGSSVPLAPGAANGSLYEWAAGALEPVSVEPAGEGGAVVSAELGSGAASVRGAVSEGGSRVFWSTGGESPDALYVRDSALGQTLRLDTVQPGGFGTGKAEPLFQGASADGRVALFTDTRNLTEDANEEGADLYRCELAVEEGELGCALSDLSAPTENPADRFESAAVQGLLPGMSEDGTMVYLVARGVLDAKANAEGEAALPGEPNLYLWRQGAGTRFIATLSDDGATWDGADWGVFKLAPGVPPRTSNLTAAASPSGRYLAFVSSRPLTGYDNRDAASGERDEEAFLYDAQADELLCASCDPSGARPRGLVGVEETQIPVASDPNHLWGGRALAATLPEATRVTGGGPSLYTPRYVHDDGRLFFNAADSLLGADANGNWDVYEYEPHGVGSCTASATGAATAAAPGGCVSLISSGTAEAEAAFLDASEGGDDVFFYTPAQLSVLDEDHVTDIYDARVDGEPARLAPRAECQGEACQPPALTPELRTPASAAFRGPGNLREAARGAGRCAAPARRAKRLSARARRLRRHAKAAARHSAKRRKAKRMSRKATRLAERARANSKRARRCRRRARRNSSR